MGFFVYLLVYAATFLLSQLFAPKPEVEDARPSGLGDFNFPTATEGRSVPLLWGTVEISAPNIVWYGDLRTQRIREKIKTGLFSSKKVTVGYQYFVGLQFALCRGPMNAGDGLLRIRVDDDPIFDNFSSSPVGTPVNNATISVNEPNLFGQDSGGISGNFTVFPGTETQARSTYLEGILTSSPDTLPAYRGTHYVIAERIYIGNSPSLRPFKFTVRRIPNGLGLAASSSLINNLDANPMNVLYEILTDSDWGLAISSGDIDTATFTSIANTLATEGNGFSAVLDGSRKAEAIIQEVERQVDGVLVRDVASGQYTFNLIRDTDIPSPITSLPLIDQTIAETVDFSRATWSETSNQVRVEYSDPNKDYAKSFGLAQDMANELIQNANVSVTEQFMGVKNGPLANAIAWRDLRALATPLAKASISVNRELYTLKPGDLFLLTWPPLGITNFLMRVNRLNFGELTNNKMVVDAIEDVFTSQSASFGDPIDSGWVPPTQAVAALAAVDQLIFETPRLMNLQDPDTPLVVPRITTVARLTGGSGDEYVTLTRENAVPPTGAYTTNTGTTPNFVLAGTLRNSIPATGDPGAFPALGSEAIQVDPLPGESLVQVIDASAAPESEINSLLTLVYVTPNAVSSPDIGRDGGEFILYTQAVESIGGSPQVAGIQLNNCYRGALDSAIQGWPAGSRVWFLSEGGTGISSESFTDQFFVDAKILPSTQDSGPLPEGSAIETNVIQVDSGFRVNLPLAPNELILETVRYRDSVVVAVNFTDIDFVYTRRNWRTNGALRSIEGENNDGTAFDPGGADAGDGLSYIYELYDESSPNIGSPDLIVQGETAVDSSTNNAFAITPNDILGVVVDPEGGRLRIEITAKHRTTSPGLLSREKLIHSFDYTDAGGTTFYDPALFLGRIPYGTIVSPGVLIQEVGSPGSPQSINQLDLRFANGARLNDGPGTGDNGRVFFIIDDGSPALLVADGQGVSPFAGVSFPGIDRPGVSPSEWVGVTLNILHYHNTGRPIFFQITNPANGSVVAWGILETLTSTVPLVD